MTDPKPPSPWTRGNSQRDRGAPVGRPARAAHPGDLATRQPGAVAHGAGIGTGSTAHAPSAAGGIPIAPRPAAELRLYGLNAVRAAFARRPQALRKLYLTQARIHELQPLLQWCVANRLGYRVVEDSDLQKLASSSHHEGVVAEVLRDAPLPLSDWLQSLPDGPRVAVLLDGVGNPHNLGAIARSAAHFGAAGLLLPHDATLAWSGAAARVAEGGAEVVPLVRLPDTDDALQQLRDAGFVLAGTPVRGGADVFAAHLPARLVLVLGAESDGMDPGLARACDLQLSIPGNGSVDSLNVAAATAVLLAMWRAAR